MTALPDSEAQTSFALNAPLSNTLRMASATAPASMIAPSTMASGGTGADGERGDAVSFARRLQLHRLDGAGPDVQAHDGFDFAKHSTLSSRSRGAMPRRDREYT